MSLGVLATVVLAWGAGLIGPIPVAFGDDGTITANGASVTAVVASPGVTAKHIFEGIAGEVVTVTASGGTFPNNCDAVLTLQDPGGDVIAGGNCSGLSAFIIEHTLPGLGVYTLSLVPQNSNTGHVNLSLSASSGTNTILVNDLPITFTSGHGGQGRDFTFSASAGQVVTATSSGGTFAGNCDLTMEIIDTYGDVLVGPTCAAQGGFLGETTLPAAGVYTLALHPVNGNTGQVNLSLSADQSVGTIAVNGAPLVFTSSQPGQGQDFRFTGTAGEVLSARSSGGTFPGNCDLEMGIVGPFGQPLGGPVCAGQEAFIGETTLPISGVYILDLIPMGGQTGQVMLTLSANQAAQSIVANASPVTFTAVHPGQGQDFTFNATAGEVVTATASGGSYPGNCDVRMVILSPDGFPDSSAVCAGQSGFLGERALSVAGVYTLDVYPENGNAGQVHLSLSANAASAGIVANGAAVKFTSVHSGQGQDFTFNATAGEVVTVTASGGTFAGGCDVRLQILNPNGGQLPSGACVGTAAFYPETTLPVAGLYTLDVVPVNGNTGHVNLSLSANPPTDAIVANGATVTFTSAHSGQGQDFMFHGTSGERVTVTVSSGTFAGPCDVKMQILNPFGYQFAGYTCAGRATSLGPLTLPVAGAYTIDFVPADGNTGSAKVKLTSP